MRGLLVVHGKGNHNDNFSDGWQGTRLAQNNHRHAIQDQAVDSEHDVLFSIQSIRANHFHGKAEEQDADLSSVTKWEVMITKLPAYII